MSQKISSHIPIDDEIQRIAKELLNETKIRQLITIRSADDDEAPSTGIKYQRGDSISIMEKMELLEIIEVDENLVYKNRHSGDTTLFKYPIYQVKINVSQINKFLQNPDVRLFLQDPSQTPLCSPGDVIGKHEKLTIVDLDKKYAYLHYEGLNPSKKIKKGLAWFEVFTEFVKYKRLDRETIKAVWNTASSASGTKKVIHNVGEIPNKIQQVYKALRGKSPEIASKITINQGKKRVKNSYFLEIK